MPADFIERISKGPGLCAGGYYLELEGRCLGSYKSHIPMGVLDYPEGMLEIDKKFARGGGEIIQAMVRQRPRPQTEGVLPPAAPVSKLDASGGAPFSWLLT